MSGYKAGTDRTQQGIYSLEDMAGRNAMVRVFVKIALLTVLLLVLSSCTTLSFRSDDSLEARARRNRRYFPIIVSNLPDGFIPLNSVLEMDGILRTLFWSTNFVIQDAEHVTVFQTDVHDDSFIVIYKSQYYICGNQFSQILDNAMHTLEQLNRRYSVGEAMEMRGRPNNTIYTITMISVERLETDTVAMYEINFSIFPSVDSNNIIDFFESAVLQSGSRLYNFVLVNDEKVTLEINRTEFLDTLILNIPSSLRRFTSQYSTRMVSLQ